MNRTAKKNGSLAWKIKGVRLLAMVGVLIWLITDSEVYKSLTDTTASAFALQKAIQSAAGANQRAPQIYDKTHSKESNYGNDTQSRP